MRAVFARQETLLRVKHCVELLLPVLVKGLGGPTTVHQPFAANDGNLAGFACRAGLLHGNMMPLGKDPQENQCAREVLAAMLLLRSYH